MYLTSYTLRNGVDQIPTPTHKSRYREGFLRWVCPLLYFTYHGPTYIPLDTPDLLPLNDDYDSNASLFFILYSSYITRTAESEAR